MAARAARKIHAGEVSVVRPIVKTTALFIVVFMAIFLHGEEKITRLVVIGSIMMAAGIAVIIVWSLTVPRNGALDSQAKAVEARRSPSAHSAAYAA